MSSGPMDKGKLKKLNLLIDQSKAFSQIIAKSLLPTPDASSPSSSEASLKEEHDASDEQLNTYGQPERIQNVTLKPHQLRGLNWLVNLYQNGLNGILADEMGLGKTLQTIALIAFLAEQNIRGPYLVVAPLNVVTNWAMEFEKFAPSLKVLPYVGPKDQRKKLRTGGWKKWDVIITSYELSMVDFNVMKRFQWTYLVVDEGHRLKNFKSQLFTKLKELNCSNRLLLTGTPLQNNLVELWALLNFILPNVFHDFHTFKNYFNFEEFEKLKDDDHDGHEENDDVNTLINLSMKKALVSNLHTILKPFILRRLKKDVLKLPPKREYIVYSKHTPMQMELYKGFLETSCHIGLKMGSTRKVLEREQAARHVRMTLIETFLPIYIKYNEPHLQSKVKSFMKLLKIDNQLEHNKEIEIVNGLDLLMKRKKRRNQVNYNEDSIDYGETQKRQIQVNKLELSPIYPYYEALLKHFKAKSVLNPLPLLRQVCDSPYLLCWPWQEGPNEHIVLSDSENENDLSDKELRPDGDNNDDEFGFTEEMKKDRYNDLVFNTAKLQTLDSLIPAILKRNPNERILVFSQFIRTLKVLQVYFEDHPLFTVDDNIIFPKKTLVLHGAHSVEERNDLFDAFSQKDKNGACNGPQIFLLSTKAANLGLNLTMASSVILYDCDYNPTVDAQAIARVHRIGQTKECLVYRLVSQATVEEIVVRKGEGKTWLADVVVESGGFDGRIDKRESVNNELLTDTKDIKFNDKDSLLVTLYRLYKLVNRNETTVAIKDNELSEVELYELTNKEDWDPECDYKEQAKIEFPHVRMFADSNVESNGDDFISLE